MALDGDEVDDDDDRDMLLLSLLLCWNAALQRGPCDLPLVWVLTYRKITYQGNDAPYETPIRISSHAHAADKPLTSAQRIAGTYVSRPSPFQGNRYDSRIHSSTYDIT